ncbi:MAG TPA: DMT family transporter [Ignavibacteriaceae bacterium]|nr:DMT family transporter [Ignavibacteriaceae bacterium]
MRKVPSAYLKPLLATTFWGVSFIATKTALNELTPVMIIILRLLLGITFLIILAVYTKSDFSIKFKQHAFIFLLAVIAVIHLWIQVTGLQYTSAANTGWIIGTSPVFMTIMGMIFFKEKLTLSQLAGIIIAFAGLVLLISKGNIASIGFISHKGDFLVLASAFTWGAYSMVNKKISLTYPPVMTILYLFIMMAIILLPVTANKETIFRLEHLSVISCISILFLGIFCSGISYVLWAQSLKDMDSSKVGAFLYFEPFVTVFSAWIFLNENITLLMIISGIIIITGVIIVNRN